MEEEFDDRKLIKVEYYLEGDDMTDEEFSNQEAQVFIITKSMIIEREVEIEAGKEIDWDNVYINKL
jgi:hypothetical protein